MTPAIRIHQDARGDWQAHPVTLNYSSPLHLDAAVGKVQRSKTVFVLPEDAAHVLDAARGVTEVTGVGGG